MDNPIKQHSPGYKYASLQYVDQAGGNLLLRGPVPVTTPHGGATVYDYGGLAEAIQHVMPSVSLPDYTLIDVCLLHDTEAAELTAIIDFFADPQNTGSVSLWDTYGTDICYFRTDPDKRTELLNTFDQWLPEPLVWRTAALRQLLEISYSKPALIYVHCDGGCDRTGEMIGAYRLRYMNASWADVIGEQPCARPMGCGNYRALQWYAFWLNATLGFSISGVGIDGGCYNPGIVHRVCTPDAADEGAAVIV